MSSGQRRIFVQDNELAEPEDIVRLQNMIGTARQEILRDLYSRNQIGDFHRFPGTTRRYTAAHTAGDINGDVLGGLMVRPDNVGFLHIDPGTVGMFAPGFSGISVSPDDDTPYLVVTSPGIQDSVTLTFSANGGPGIRWDIVECRPIPTEVVQEQASVQLYGPVTQTFSSSTENKVLAAELEFRIRAGTQGNGIPDPDPDWCPLAAVHVRTDSTGFNNTDLYDLRPLVAERCPWSPRHPLVVQGGSLAYRYDLAEADFGHAIVAGVNGAVLNGFYRAHFGGYWAGGEIRKNTPAAAAADFGVDALITDGEVPYFNPEDVRNQSSAGITTQNALLTIGAFFPRGYPRWVRYSQSSQPSNATTRLREAGRFPMGPRGILAIVDDAALTNGMIDPQSLPAVVGETTVSYGHVVQAEIATASAGRIIPAVGGTSDRRLIWPDRTVTFQGGSPTAIGVGGGTSQNLTVAGVISSSVASIMVTLPNGASGQVPANARGFLIRLTVDMSLTGSTDGTTNWNQGVTALADGAGIPIPNPQGEWSYNGSAIASFDGLVWVPRIARNTFDNTLVGATQFASWIMTENGAVDFSSFSVLAAQIVGYQL